ncbi:MAG: ATP-grasp domain-containing protein [Ruminococcaceae bacterium]|nr:ATP-grasp domain-containing protein [Oscillospiraceae bacterium]
MKALVLCGGVPQIALIKELKSRGITTILADMNDKVPAKEYADKFYKVSVLDIEAVRKVVIDEKVDYLISVCADQVLQVVAQIAEEEGLPWYIDYETAENVSKKSYMKKIFWENGVPTTKYVILDKFDADKISHLNYPIIVKPVDAYSSRGVCKVQNIEQLRDALDKAIEISRTKTAIVEEFAEGDEISVDIYVEEGKAHVLCLTNIYKIGEDGKFIINRSRIPADVSPEIAEKIADTAQKIADAFGLKNTPMLVQLISDGEKISVIEFCARTGGGIKFQMIKRVSGFDVIKAVVDLTLGEKPHVGEIKKSDKLILNEFVYTKAGELKSVEGFEELLSDGTIAAYSVFKAPGTKFTQINSSGDRVAFFSIEADSVDEIKKKHTAANERIRAISTDGQDLIRHDLIAKFNA